MLSIHLLHDQCRPKSPLHDLINQQESLANAKVSARQQCVYECL